MKPLMKSLIKCLIILKLPSKYIVENSVCIKRIISLTVGITWDDAPTEQNAVINTDYKIRCVVLASPPATIDWLKESLIVSTGKKRKQKKMSQK